VAGGVLALAALTLRALPDLALVFFGWSRWLFAGAAILVLLGFVSHRPPLARPALAACLSVSSLVLGLATLEGLFRALQYDFDRTAAALRRLPPFFRKPDVPTGSVFYRRPGPERWTGQPLRALLDQQRIQPNPYLAEPVITVAYDALGFRNEQNLTDWEVAVAGDSFTELGHLPFGEIVTTRLGELVGKRVRNLGVSHTGPLTHLHYLETFGLAPSTRDVVILFYEGNDFADLAYEAAELERFARTGHRLARGRRPQSSFLRALRRSWDRRSSEPRIFAATANAWFVGSSGREAVTIVTPPILVKDLSDQTREALEVFLERYAGFAHAHGVAPRLAYLPTKETVWRDRLVLGPEAPEGWATTPRTDLPAYLTERCAAAGIAFLDLTRPLIAATERQGARLYNGMYDTHLNARGTELVARELAQWLTHSNGARDLPFDAPTTQP